MASNQTANFGLSQWEATDKVLREEFNADNAKIDAALAKIPSIVIDSFVGNGATTRDIDLGRRPQFVIVWESKFAALTDASYAYWGMSIGTLPPLFKNQKTVEITDSGFRVFNTTSAQGAQTNFAEADYSYLAIL